MPKRISVAKHLTIEQLEQHYRQAKDGVESRQYQIIWLLAQGKKTEEVEEITGYSRTWIYTLVKRYNEFGAEGLGDSRNQNQGTKPLIDDALASTIMASFTGEGSRRRAMEWSPSRRLADVCNWATGEPTKRMGNIATDDFQIASSSTISYGK